MPRRPGFTLIDLLITVTIIAILAALVIPQFSTAADQTRGNRTQWELQTVRGQLELYRSHHHGRCPTLAQMFTNLITRTDENGLATEGEGFGPYMKKAPINPYTNSETVAAPGTGTAVDGWTYDETTGAFTAVGFDELTKTYTAPGGHTVH